jgi:DNA-binding NtrC family response regulator
MAKCDILIVDDDETIRSVLLSLFREEGYRVQTAENGRQALEVLDRVDCAVLLTDLKMPIMDGLELARVLRDQEIEIPLVVMTAVGGISPRALEMGAAAYIEKPFDFDSLLETVGEVVQEARESHSSSRLHRN